MNSLIKHIQELEEKIKKIVFSDEVADEVNHFKKLVRDFSKNVIDWIEGDTKGKTQGIRGQLHVIRKGRENQYEGNMANKWVEWAFNTFISMEKGARKIKDDIEILRNHLDKIKNSCKKVKELAKTWKDRTEIFCVGGIVACAGIAIAHICTLPISGLFMLGVAASYVSIIGISTKFFDASNEAIAKCNKIDAALKAIGTVVDKFEKTAYHFEGILGEGKFASEIKGKNVEIDWNSQEVRLITKHANRLYDLLDV